ncbi:MULTISPECIES: SDR family NAD(P)-dependent oxidoreductase [unclassified Rathayibacter]|uniref:SDR family NAD(P)-dependent oxidoreductase n=1 Tax=unclassified Rathayibacter TaxID=2609250 RepID=UPI000F4C9456|nr:MULTISPECIES: SDR family oxidoreductase [unclassified Rathayibacter]ROP49182.1 NAD(P)-dependent dehydrogenase (short-subunit alcohol dehydrogenase family) [Rathayibacter sp. PhB186]ROS50701.1 NAD(P)-dependent dehydrogenase (short-subunit alcohol dehydrogenase family) [Rathayibacter sp. PhB185]
MAEFDGLVAAITGGASGIGLASAQLLHERGACVIVLDISVDDPPEGLTGFRCDVTDRASIDDALERVQGRAGGLDVLVNNAGISAVGTVEENDDAEWSRVLDVNITGIARVTAAALPLLRLSDHASVVNLSSIAAANGLPRRALYSASKGAVHALTLAMATDHVREGIRVNCVTPGTVDTPFVARMLEAFPDPVVERAALDARQANGRMATPAEVASAIAFLATPLSGSITGTSLLVDGGVTTLRMRPL